MATIKPPTIVDLQVQAQTLVDEINAKGITISDKKSIVESAKKLLAIVNDTIPHISQANTAGFNVGDASRQANDLKNTLSKVIAAYSGA